MKSSIKQARAIWYAIRAQRIANGEISKKQGNKYYTKNTTNDKAGA